MVHGRLPLCPWAQPSITDTVDHVMKPLSAKGTAVKRVLIADFGAIATLGLCELLEEQCEIVAAGISDDQVAETVRMTAADAVLIDLESPQADSITRLLQQRHPSTIVIGCSLSEPQLTVLAGPGASYTAELDPASLIEAVNGP